MIITEMKCVKCKETFTRERGYGAKPFTTGSICEKCVTADIKQEKSDIKDEKAELKAEEKAYKKAYKK